MGTIHQSSRLDLNLFNGKRTKLFCDSYDLSKPGRYRVHVTPDEAKAWLERFNAKNPRRFYLSHGKDISSAMSSGDFPDDHSAPLLFDENGDFFDGQHRVFGVIDSGVAVWFTVLTGVPLAIRKTIDIGKNRPLNVRVQFSDDYTTNEKISRFVKTYHRVKNGSHKQALSVYEQFYVNHFEAIDFVTAAINKSQRGIGRAPVGVALMEMYERNKQKAADFVDSLIIVDGYVQQARQLRDWCLKNLTGGGSGVDKMFYEKSVYCMDMYLRDKEVGRKILSGKWTD